MNQLIKKAFALPKWIFLLFISSFIQLMDASQPNLRNLLHQHHGHHHHHSNCNCKCYLNQCKNELCQCQADLQHYMDKLQQKEIKLNDCNNDKTKLKEDKKQCEKDKTKLESDKTKLESEKTKLESVKTKLEADNEKCEADKKACQDAEHCVWRVHVTSTSPDISAWAIPKMCYRENGASFEYICDTAKTYEHPAGIKEYANAACSGSVPTTVGDGYEVLKCQKVCEGDANW